MAGNFTFWNNVRVQMGSNSDIGAARTITAISKASPAVATYTGTDPANGNWVLIECQGMSQLNGGLYRVAAVNTAAKTFQIEGVDSTLFDTFISGTFKVVTFSKSATGLYNPSGSGGEAVTEDTSVIHDSQDSSAVVSSTALSYDFQAAWDPSDPFLIEGKVAHRDHAPRPVLVIFPNGARTAYFATVNCPLVPLQDGRKVSTKVSFALKGDITTYAT